MKQRTSTWAALAAIAVCWSTAGAAETVERPKIGLVLSGGGARGSAHVGVLKVMEELRIPVDYVVGTSMGSIVGGLYASGLSPEEIEQGFRDVDWVNAFNDKPDRKRIAFRLKQDDVYSLLPFELGVGKGGFSRRSGIINGQKINLILRTMVSHVVGIDDFDRLNLPYRAVAADLSSGDAVVMGRGDLAQSIRASMSVPGVFTPVEIDGRWLIDGGTAMNLPVEVALQMGAERIIAVDVGTPPKGVDGSISALKVVSQTFSVLAKRNVEEQLKLISENDLVIVPELNEIGASDFDKLLEGVDVGEQAARRMESHLREFSVSEEEFENYLRRQRTIPEEQRPAVVVDSVEVLGLTRTDPDFIQRRLRSQPGQPLTEGGVVADLERVNQLGEFENVDVRLIKEDDQTRLLFDAQEKSWGPSYLRFGLGAETNFDGDSDFRAIANFRRPHINRRGGEWKTVAALGDPFSVKTEFFQPLNLGGIHWFVAPNLGFARDKDARFLPGGALEVIEQETSWASFDVGVQFRNWGEIRVGARRGTFAGETSTTSTLDDFDLDLGGWQVTATLDQLDNVFFPTAGSLIKVDAFLSRDSLGADREYDKLSLRALGAWGGERDTLLGSLNVGTDLGSDLPFHDEFSTRADSSTSPD